MLRSDSHAAVAGVDAVALKPAEHDWTKIPDLHDAFETVTIDYEGREHLPDFDALADLADADREVRLTTPVRADGFDPVGDDSLSADLPEHVGRVVVAGHSAYLSETEAERAIAPRFGAAVAADGDAWVGTEGVERAALATGATQFELLARSTERTVRSLRAAGFDGEIAVYAPTVLSDDEDEILDAVGAYAARRRPVARALPEDAATDGTADGRAREVLSKAVRDYALVGDAETVGERVDALRAAGVDHVVAYPAAGLDAFLD
ncbi:DUF7388 family protein [Halobacterium wangiae]|uniref:DUF7388 family protein n=1 Tax=Halobacterium wangiae TaxID=2902623 RepID=UPI001E615384|nr:luciferase [Halobacterium wangiae]